MIDVAGEDNQEWNEFFKGKTRQLKKFKAQSDKGKTYSKKYKVAGIPQQRKAKMSKNRDDSDSDGMNFLIVQV